jgi:hypothetical protein
MARFLIRDRCYFKLSLQSLPRRVLNYGENFLVRKLQIFQMVSLLVIELNQLVEYFCWKSLYYFLLKMHHHLV